MSAISSEADIERQTFDGRFVSQADTDTPEGDVERLRVFANSDAANEWFKVHDPEGVAFEYQVTGIAR
jgi:hypothetical protein